DQVTETSPVLRLQEALPTHRAYDLHDTLCEIAREVCENRERLEQLVRDVDSIACIQDALEAREGPVRPQQDRELRVRGPRPDRRENISALRIVFRPIADRRPQAPESRTELFRRIVVLLFREHSKGPDRYQRRC